MFALSPTTASAPPAPPAGFRPAVSTRAAGVGARCRVVPNRGARLTVCRASCLAVVPAGARRTSAIRPTRTAVGGGSLFATNTPACAMPSRRGAHVVTLGLDTGGGDTATTSTTDVDALATRLSKLKEKSNAMLAEAEALERRVDGSTGGGGADVVRDTEDAAQDTDTIDTTLDTLVSGTTKKKAVLSKALGSGLSSEKTNNAATDETRSAVKTMKTFGGLVAASAVVTVGAAYFVPSAAGVLQLEPALAMFGSLAAFAAVVAIDALTPAIRSAGEKSETKAVAKETGTTAKETKQPASEDTSKSVTKKVMPTPVNKPVTTSVAKKSVEAQKEEDKAGVVVEKTSPVTRIAAPTAKKTDTQWIDPATAASMAGGALPVNQDTDAAQRAVKADTAAVSAERSAALLAKKEKKYTFGGVNNSSKNTSEPSDETKLMELRAVAVQRMAKQKMYEEYVAARPAAAGTGKQSRSGVEKKSKDGGFVAALFKFLVFPLRLPFEIFTFVLKFLRSVLSGGGKTA